MIPTREQWKKWSLPSKLTAVGTAIGIISLLWTAVATFFASQPGVDLSPVGEKLDKLEAVVRQEVVPNVRQPLAYQTADREYLKRYLKDRLAEELVVVPEPGRTDAVRLTWETPWEPLVSHYRAAVEIRELSGAHAILDEESGWSKAVLRPADDVDEDGTVNLVGGKFAVVEGIMAGRIYELRLVDYNYDSDDPPSLPVRFTIPLSVQSGQSPVVPR